MGVAGNKGDMYDREEVNENEAREFAEKIGAFFVITSAKNNTGITDLFMNAANLFVDPNYKGNSGEGNVTGSTADTIKLGDKEDKRERRRQCC